MRGSWVRRGSARPRVQIQHQPQILHRGARRSFAEIVEMGDEHGVAERLVGADVEIEPVGPIKRLRFELLRVAADPNGYVFRTLVKGAQSLS